ncbi:biotin--[acetyl-CoA-carboxylase] ligase [Metallosphaera tengchongensis]|uniref:Biotin--[acetyl-CoA-carboxylase] ligase n=1 Tax=Metallosphaera tengchongensis TaxID=1532350 RepID=A0A6N0NRZ8_9CREN|nr:biotin--[acetyl-CoA-carboxylase] ligase [Metallosphaera tengchongensis]QKQ99643.1 biotin--[acetyl-CoA-carboxylase] ligase [Metallosphaera tengchongensis]
MQTIYLEKVTSTQDFAEAVSSMLEGDFVVVASEQTRARGRYGRKWYSPKGGLWVTYVLKNFNVEQIGVSTLRVALAIRRIVSKYVTAQIRWPNDIVVNGKKVAGILLEAINEGDANTGFIGFGINTNVTEFPQDLSATSLKLELGRDIDNDKMLGEILHEINEYIIKGYEETFTELNKYLYVKDKQVRLIGKDWEKTCKALFVDRYGRLVTECGIFEVEEVLRLESP